MSHCRAQNGVGNYKQQVVVVMVPLPAQGHLNQLLHLSRLISAHHIPVHYVGATNHNRQAKQRFHGGDTSTNSYLEFHEFQLPPCKNPPPNPNNSNKFPSQLVPSIYNAAANLREPVRLLLEKLSRSSRRVIVIFDALMASVVQDLTSIPNAESYCFRSVSAFNVYSLYCETNQNTSQSSAVAEAFRDLPSLEDCLTPEFEEYVKLQRQYRSFHHGDIFNSCRAIEGQILDSFEKDKVEGAEKLWALGPFNPVKIPDSGSLNSKKRHKCLEWLDQQAPNSVIFVSFGTTTSFSNEQINELAIGLEQSKQKFIWVLRDADKGDVFRGDVRRAELPKGYEDRVEGRGMIVRDWAPQLEILGHRATGGFMSHCGWNSCMESMSVGVPIAAWPMHSDQPRNTVLITKVLRIGIVAKDWRRRNELVRSSGIESAVRRLMDSDEGAEMRRRARDLSNAVKRIAAEHEEFDSFVAHITR